MLNWVQMYEERIIWHGLTPLHFSYLIAPTCLPSQDIHNPNLLPYPLLQSYTPSSYNTLFLCQASVSCQTYLSNPIFPEFSVGHSHLQSKTISLSVAFWHLLRYLTGWSPTASPGAIQHQKPGWWEAATLTDLPLQGLSQQVRAREQALTGSWWQPTILCAGWSLVPKCKAGLLCWCCLFGPGQLNIMYLTPLFVKQLEELTQHEDGAIRRAMEMLSYCYNHWVGGPELCA